MAKGLKKQVVSEQVTGLGEFSPLGDLLLWAVFSKTTSKAPILSAIFLILSHVIILPKNGLGHILGNFFTNSSSHPASKGGRLSLNCRSLIKLKKF
jgi:hypothetical protein